MTIHHFEPTALLHFLRFAPAALHIASGDTVVTTTIDAGGFNASGEQVGGHPNPETGPFYVDGAEPGDTLQVHLEYLYPNRETGYSYSPLAPHVVDPTPCPSCRNASATNGASNPPATPPP